jgi:hypothetical protein
MFALSQALLSLQGSYKSSQTERGIESLCSHSMTLSFPRSPYEKSRLPSGHTLLPNWGWTFQQADLLIFFFFFFIVLLFICAYRPADFQYSNFYCQHSKAWLFPFYSKSRLPAPVMRLLFLTSSCILANYSLTVLGERKADCEPTQARKPSIPTVTQSSSSF